jgi:ubiquinone biosynthesis protein Coq4
MSQQQKIGVLLIDREMRYMFSRDYIPGSLELDQLTKIPCIISLGHILLLFLGSHFITGLI